MCDALPPPCVGSIRGACQETVLLHLHLAAPEGYASWLLAWCWGQTGSFVMITMGDDEEKKKEAHNEEHSEREAGDSTRPVTSAPLEQSKKEADEEEGCWVLFPP